jgi:two-component system response regulator AtoC
MRPCLREIGPDLKGVFGTGAQGGIRNPHRRRAPGPCAEKNRSPFHGTSIKRVICLTSLKVVRLGIPPLRDRREEIPPLVHHFVDRWSREAHKTGIRIADETMEYLILYNWPGNVRQLANELRRMVTLAETHAVLMPEHLSHQIASSRRTVPVSQRSLAPTEFIVRMDQPMSAAMDHLERSMIQYAMKQSGGRVEDAATRLGLSRKGLYLKRQRLHIEAAADGRPVVQP